MKYVSSLIILLLLTFTMRAQSSQSETYYKKNPAWIKMMNDTSSNYFETIKAFKLYYEDRALPKEANEQGDDLFEREVGLEPEEGERKSEKEKERESRKQNPKEPNYSAEVRAFRSWFYSIKPWVRSDGQIIGPAEQQAIIDQQHQELLEIEKQNNKR